MLALLDLLKNDPELYVRRSVANNLNDIGKDHPQVLTDTAQARLQNASAERAWIVGHALRSAVKQGDGGALKVLGFGKTARVNLAVHFVKANGQATAKVYKLKTLELGAREFKFEMQLYE